MEWSGRELGAVKKKRIFGVLSDAALAFEFFSGVGKGLEIIRVYDFEMHSALISAVETRYDIGYLIPPSKWIDNLLSERILVVIIDQKVWTKSVVEEWIIILKNDLDCIFGILIEIEHWQQNALLAIFYLMRL